jgi:3-hydroxyacyl-CoA dehydrogenase
LSVKSERRDGIVVLTLDYPPVNALGVEVLTDLAAAIEAGSRDDGVHAFVLTGANGAFSGGADIRRFGKPWPPTAPMLPEVIESIERSEKPFYAAIDGVALGGGCELALVCDARYASPRSRVGLPEVHLGLLPGAGGTQRLPRLVGAKAALDIIVSGMPVGAARAAELGIVDEIVAGNLLDHVCRVAQEAPAGTRRRVSARRSEAQPGVFSAMRAKLDPVERGGLAAHRCTDAVEASTWLPFEQGLHRERELFTELLHSDQSRARIHVFFAEREAVKIPDVPASTPVARIDRACVVGAGTMGGGIAMSLANGGIPADVVEAEPEALARGKATIERNYAASARKGRISQADVEARLGRIAYGTSLSAAAGGADLVIEAVFEELDVKLSVFAELDRACKPGAVLASNTSTLDIDAIAGATARPEDVIGTHFFSPANVMRLLEIVRGAKTSARSIATALALAKRIGKIGVVARTCDGFIGNRMLAHYAREAAYLVEEGALPQDVDRVIEAFGFPMGPFAMGDLAGLDVGWRIRKRRSAQGMTGPRVPEIADRVCERGRFGQKTGAGYYRYADGDRTPHPDPEVESLIFAESARLGIARRTIDDAEILERCMLPLVNEGANILLDGTAIRPGDIDVVWVYGYGFPAFRGGPMHYADMLGLMRVFESLRALEARLGPHWHPSPLIEELVASKRRFADLAADEAARLTMEVS